MLRKLQEEIVQEVAALIDSDWDRITVNIEIDSVDGELVLSPEADWWNKEEPEELRVRIDVRNLFKNLRSEMQKSDSQNRPWTICDLEILSDGAFEFKFSYDKPPRLAALK